MTLVFVAKGMYVQNPVGVLNLNPLPGLPSGVVRAHLLRHSLEMTRMNLVDGQNTGLVELGPSEAIFTYTDIGAGATPRRAGWYDEAWHPDFQTGFTWMAVCDPQLPNEFSAPVIALGDVTGTQPVSLLMRENGARLQFRSPEEDSIDLSAMDGAPYDRPAMVFASMDISGAASVYIPHDQNNAADNISYMAEVAAHPEGVSIASHYSGGDESEPPYMHYMAAEWGRVLSQGEMDAAYMALKPWLAARGVIIA